jgi:hypothetical protein
MSGTLEPGLCLAAARERAEDDARSGSRPDGAADGRPRTLELVMGDPQAPFEKVLAVLDGHGLLGEDGRLRPEVALCSIGDHFDYGDEPASVVERSGRLLLAWLAAHPADQVTLIIGNHDLARVGELATFDDERFRRAHEAAAQVGEDDEREASFVRNFPELPSSEVARRDFNGFSVAQRELVTHLLRSRRFHAAVARGRILLLHAGVTLGDLEEAGGSAAQLDSAQAIAAFLDARLRDAFASWSGREPFVVPGLHSPGNAENGEGGGIFYHRPCQPERVESSSLSGPFRRRFDPRRLPPGVTQVIGHIRDDKCRKLLGEWAVGRAANDGELRHLIADREHVRYAAGLPEDADDERARMIFTDGGMNNTEASAYELFNPETRSALRPRTRRA